ncbi:MAG: hypothetical protein IJW45_01300 [Oscillospiraceae bacterium]|nr:hypothetical protein [Oscillospiraceae bacterium]
MERICFVFGHREVAIEAAQRVLPELHGLVEQGVKTFVMWPGGGFEGLVAASLRILQQNDPAVQVLCLRADPDDPVPAGFDGIYCPPGLGEIPKRFAETHSSRAMAALCHQGLCYVDRRGNAQILLGILQRRGVPVVDLA